MGAPWLMVAGDFSRRGGMDKANYHLAWYLAERLGRPVRLVAHRVSEPLASHPLVTVATVPRPRGLHLLGMPLLDRAGRHAAARLKAAHPEARVVVNGGNCSWPGVNWVHMVHHASPVNDAGAPPLARLKTRLVRHLFRRTEARCLPAARLVIANSDKTRREVIDLLGLAPRRVHVVYLAADAAAVTPASADERAGARRRLGVDDATTVLLFVGVLGYDMNKGLDTLLRALGRLRGAAGVLLLVAGGGQLDFWRRRAEALGVAGRVRFLGFADDVGPLLAATDLLVSPTRYDAYGLAVHEALCRGCPAVVSRRAGVAERYPAELQSLLLDDPDDPDELAGRVDAWHARREELRPALERFGADLGARTWDDVAADIVTLVEAEA